jgi:hypothetical protein
VGDTLDHCIRPTVGVSCNATCGPDVRVEGAAVVRVEAVCKNKIAVDARV